MATWTNEELDRIGNAEELQLASLRDDRGLRHYVTMLSLPKIGLGC